jgi:hypothetical protein
MIIHFISNKVEKLFCSEDDKSHISKLQKLFKDRHLVECMIQRINQLIGFETLLDVKNTKWMNLHPLKWSRKFELAIDIDASTNTRWRRRIIFEQVNGEDVCKDFFNDAKHKTVTEIRILELSDHYS